jgi:hypothetical protein
MGETMNFVKVAKVNEIPPRAAGTEQTQWMSIRFDNSHKEQQRTNA